jgi:hypothetical protein
MTKEQAKAIVEKLVNRYTEQQKSYHAADYNETKTRRDFIDPFFKALGWDMDNEQDVAEPYREVIHEDKIKIQGKTKSPDYGFRLQGAKQQLFFVEAKKPSVSLKTNKESSFQIRRYGWNSKVSVSILTNFEDFIVYDCSKKPNINDSASVARLKTISYDQYLQEFDFIYDTFSREAVVKGRFDSYVKSDTAKKGTQTLDKEFVASLDTWRRYLATDLAKSNLKLNEDELNFAVQLIIDRLIFLRFCEDRGVETYGQLKAATSKGNAYENLHVVFQAADDKYNSGLFDFEKDKITHNLKVTNKVIKSIVEDLYPPNSEYDFKAMPVEVLGNAYEQFLGKVIRIDKAHHAVIEEKPEVRKAGGVFYTPQYIVDYIVENTVGKLIEGKTPKEIETIKIVDPACGSGSFLLGAFDYLLKYHINYYYKNPPSAKSGIITPNGTLSTAEKKKIILNNIFGVDLDANAVEVSKLSLLLKCMEGETEASIKQQITMFHERVLPDLDNNIKDGNSLIDTDIYDSEMELGFEKKIKPFSWKKQFPSVFKQGGFDVVVGNPPYVTLQLGKKQESQEKDVLCYYESHYTHSFEYKINLYALFLERSVSLLNPEGLFSFIIPSTFYNTKSFSGIRKYILNSGSLNIIMDLRYKVFADAEIGGCAIFVFSKTKKQKEIELLSVNSESLFETPTVKKISSEELMKDKDFNFVQSKGANKIFEKINALKNIVTLGSITKIYQGIITGDNKKYLSDNPSNEKWKPIIKGRDINRYSTTFGNNYVYYSPEELWSNTDEKMFKVPSKIISRQTSDKIVATLDKNQYFSLDSTHVIHLLFKEIDIKYLLGIYNSRLLNFLYQSRVQEHGRVFAQVKTINIKPLLVKLIDNKNKQEVSLHNEIVKNVDLLLNLNEEIKEIKLQTKIAQVKQRIEHSEDKINQLVYELYELTEDEIAIVENSIKN